MKKIIIKILKEEIRKKLLYYKELLHYQNYLNLKIIKMMMMNILDQEKNKKKKSRNKNNSVHNNIIFDSPYIEMYFLSF